MNQVGHLTLPYLSGIGNVKATWPGGPVLVELWLVQFLPQFRFKVSVHEAWPVWVKLSFKLREWVRRRLGLGASSTRWRLWRWMLAFGRPSWLWVCSAFIHDLLWHGTWSSLAARQRPKTYRRGTAGTQLSCLLYGAWSRVSGAWGSVIFPHMCKVSDRQLVWSPCAGPSKRLWLVFPKGPQARLPYLL